MQLENKKTLLFGYHLSLSRVGSKIERRTTTFGKADKVTDMLCICHSQREDLCYTGTASGEIYVWQDSTYRKSIPAHKGPVYAMFAILQSEEKVIAAVVKIFIISFYFHPV